MKRNTTIIVSTLFLFAFNLYALDNGHEEKETRPKSVLSSLKRMYFDVASGILEEEPGRPGVLAGTFEANDVVIDFGSEKFEIENPGQRVIDAQLEWNEENYRLSVKKDGLKFSTPLIEGLGLSGVKTIQLNTAVVELNKEGILMKGNQLSFLHKDLMASFTSAHIFCPTYGQFTTEIDKACLKESTANIGVISFDQKALDADFIDARSFIKEDTFRLTAHKARFNDEEDTTEVDGFSMECLRLKAPEGKSSVPVDPYSLLQGCLKKGDVRIESMDSKSRLEEVIEEIWPEVLKKDPSLASQKALGDLDNIKDVILILNNNKLYPEAKAKILFRVKIKLRGSVRLDIKSSELQFKIDRATVWGIPTGKLAYRLIEKFGRGDFIEVRGDLIIFKI